MFWKRVLHTASTVDLQNAPVLADAARRVYQVALSEGLPLAHIAEQSGRPQYWFANNIIHIVEAHGRRSGEIAYIMLSREVIANLILADDMSVLIDSEDGEEKVDDLRITKEQVERYLAWARTVY